MQTGTKVHNSAGGVTCEQDPKYTTVHLTSTTPMGAQGHPTVLKRQQVYIVDAARNDEVIYWNLHLGIRP
jgi:hypothetical protein